jgi:predicted transcriptional regulator
MCFLAAMESAVEHRSVEKWGEAAVGGFQLLPDILLKRQVELGLSATDMLVLINVTMHWWYTDQRPFPRVKTISTRMGIDERTVQRSLRKMVDLGLLRRVTEKGTDGKDRSVCDLSGLKAKLEKFVTSDRDYGIRKARLAGVTPEELFESMRTATSA